MKIDKNALTRRQIDALNGLSSEELRDKFVELYGFSTVVVNTEYLLRRCAYRLQELQFGGLSQEAEDFLENMASEDPLANFTPDKPKKFTSNKGTKIVRNWNGKNYEVIVQDSKSYEYDGKLYKSLTAIAKEITGTHWNGRRFFGVDK